MQEENYKLSSDVVHLECKLTSDHDMISRLTENLEERDRHISQLEQKLSSNMEEKMAVINRSKILEENLAMKVKEMSVFSEEREHEKEATKVSMPVV